MKLYLRAKSSIAAILVIISFYIALFYGYIANIVKLVTVDIPISEWTAMEAARVIGIVVGPLGVVLGYF